MIIGSDEFGRDFGGDTLRKAAEDGGDVAATAGRGATGPGYKLGAASVLLVEIIADQVPRHLGDLRPAEVLANRNELHFRRNDALASVPELRNRVVGGRL
jgi:hypothetical protein